MGESPKLSDIQSRINDLKQKAAEAEMLRAERDLLLKQLMQYTEDYIYPDLPKADDYDKVVEENAQLMQKINDFDETVSKLEEKVRDLQNYKSRVEEMTEENKFLKQEMNKLVALEYELKKLHEEKRMIKEELKSVISVEVTSGPVAKFKRDIYRLHLRIEGLEDQKERLGREVEERTRRVEELRERIQELEGRIAVRPGRVGRLEDGLRSVVQRLEETNRGIGKELAELTEKVSAAGDQRGSKLEAIQFREVGVLTLQEVMVRRRLQTTVVGHTPWTRVEEDVLSTGPPVRGHSEEDVLLHGDELQALLSVLAYNSYYLGKVHKKMNRLRSETLRSATDISRAINSSSLLLLDSKAAAGYGRVGTSVFRINQD